MPRSLILVVLASAVACSGGEKKHQDPVPPVAKTDASASAHDGGLDPGEPLTEPECGALLRHIVVLGVEEMRAEKPPEQVPTQAQVDEIIAAMVADPDKMAGCQQQPRWAFDCAMAAKTTAAVAACQTEN